MNRKEIVETLFNGGWEMVKVNKKEATFAPVNTLVHKKFFKEDQS